MTDNSTNDIRWMHLALEEARAASAGGEVPIGAAIVVEDRVIARAGNRTIRDCDPTAHAEIVALRAAAKTIGNYRLTNAALYVTIEPCAMCAGALIQARVARVIYGADDAKGGAVRSCFQLLDDAQLNHRIDFTPGVLAEESVALLQQFFAERR